MKDRIKKLINSKILGEVILGVQMSYKLPYSEFYELLTQTTMLNLDKKFPVYYRFVRDGKMYGFGNCGFIHYGPKENYITDPKDIDITPKHITDEKS